MDVLAIDLGLRTGFAAFEGRRLVAYRSTHFANRASLKKAVWDVLGEFGPPRHVVAEGDAQLAEVWRKAAVKRGISFELVDAETWRQDVLLPRQRRSGLCAKDAAMGLAREIIDAGTAPAPVGEMTSDVAEAILIGHWASQRAQSA